MLKEKLLIEDFKNILKEKGLKCTSSREMILEIFSGNKRPIRAEDIYNKLKNKIDEATIYRTISSFKKVGLIRRVNLRRESVYFELNNDHHHHIVCEKCGEIEDFKENSEIEKILGRIVEKSSSFKIINEHSLELFGVCSKCI
jgi:Fur family transcriptional regulator, ferric uptake regulator